MRVVVALDGLEEWSKVGAAAANWLWNFATSAQAKWAVALCIAVVQIANNMWVGGQNALHLGDQRPDLSVVDRATCVDYDIHPYAFAFERIKIQSPPDEAPIEALEIAWCLI